MSVSTRNKPTRKKTARRSNAYRSSPKVPLGERLIAWTAFWLKLALGSAFVGIVSVGLLYGYRYVTEQPFFALNEVVITGNSHREDGALEALGGVEKGLNIFDLDIGQVQQRLLEDPWIDTASVRRVLPGRLEIHVHERQACFWVIRKNELWYADGRGRMIDRVRAHNFISLPVLGGDTRQEGRADAVARMVELMGTNSLPFGFASLDSLWLSEDGTLDVLLNRPRMNIRIGLKDLETNCRRMKLAWDDLKKRKEIQRVQGFQAVAGKVWAKVEPSKGSERK